LTKLVAGDRWKKTDARRIGNWIGSIGENSPKRVPDVEVLETRIARVGVT
jgi:hypothetical protein